MRIGIIGCGAVARYCHAPAIRRIDGAAVVAVADPDSASRTNVSPAARAFETADDLLAQTDVDAVIISVPTHLHVPVGVAAAQAGKSFYIEKPIAISAAGAIQLRDAVDAANVRAAVGFNRRAHPLYVRARELILGGAIGEVHAVQTVFSEPAPAGGLPEWKRHRDTGGGALLDLASHHVDMVRWLLDVEVISVGATIRSISSEEDFAALDMTLSSGARAQSMFSLSSAYGDNLEITGTRGVLRIDRHRAELTLSSERRFGYGASTRAVRSKPRDIPWRLRRIGKPGEDPSYVRALEAFVQQVRGEREALASLADGEKSLGIILAAEESARSGARVAPEGFG